MKTKFTRAIAKEIAYRQFNDTLDCVTGKQDPYWGLRETSNTFEEDFVNLLNDNDIVVTQARLKMIKDYYDKLVKKVLKKLNTFYVRPTNLLKY